jgi:hypothetical protein
MNRIALTLLCCFAFLGLAHGAEISLEEHDKQIDVLIDGKLFTTYLHDGYRKPILYPIIGPNEIPITRNWPMKKDVAGEAHDHPHQKSMWFTHSPVNGVNFWTESDKTGTIVQTKLVRAECGKEKESAVIETENDWQDPQGKVLLSDNRKITFSLVPGGRAIDWRIELKATHGPVTFGDSKEGGMGIRTRPELQLKNFPKQGVTNANGHAVNSEGANDGDIWGKRANWVDYWAEIDGKTIGVAIFDHPDNLRHPTWWHARDYGLISANPFGIHDFEKKKPDDLGNYTIPDGKSLTLRYRFIFHEGNPETAKIAELFKEYSQGK